jgi:sulfide:quinone oxidoreductase
MSTQAPPSDRLRVIIAGAGVAGLETALALAELAPELTDVTLIAPDPEFIYRPMTVREPFAYARAQRYPVERIAGGAGARLIADGLAWVDRERQVVHTKGGQALEYDALVLATGADLVPRYQHAITVDDRHLDETMHGLIQDIEGGYVKRLAFVAPARMAWPLPLYELALMTAGRAFDASMDLTAMIITPEDAPLAIFGQAASDGVASLLERAGIEMIGSSYVEVPQAREVTISPGERRLEVDRVVALPELAGPPLRGIPLTEHGFVQVDPYGQVPHAGPVYAAGDTTDFPVKQGGVGSQQADVVAQSIASRAGANVRPQPFHPVLRGMLLTGEKPRYLTAQITGGQGFSSEISETASWSPPSKISARYLSPFLEMLDRESDGRTAGDTAAEREAALA